MENGSKPEVDEEQDIDNFLRRVLVLDETMDPWRAAEVGPSCGNKLEDLQSRELHALPKTNFQTQHYNDNYKSCTAHRERESFAWLVMTESFGKFLRAKERAFGGGFVSKGWFHCSFLSVHISFAKLYKITFHKYFLLFYFIRTSYLSLWFSKALFGICWL